MAAPTVPMMVLFYLLGWVWLSGRLVSATPLVRGALVGCVALAEALEVGRVNPGALILMPACGAGLTVCAHLVRWGDRVTPLGSTDADLPPNRRPALEIINGIRSGKTNVQERSGEGLRNLKFVEQL